MPFLDTELDSAASGVAIPKQIDEKEATEIMLTSYISLIPHFYKLQDVLHVSIKADFESKFDEFYSDQF
jgi:hypothetical protein